MIRPSEDLALYRADMAEWDGRRGQPDWRESRRDWVRANDACRLDILDRLGASGPLPSRDLPDTGWSGLVLGGEVLVLHLPRMVECMEGRVSDEEW